MAVTLTKLKTAVIVKMGETSDDGMLTNLVDTINAGLSEMATEFDWPWLIKSGTITTIAGTSDYTVPSDCVRVRRIVNTTSTAYALVVRQEEDLLNYNGSTGQPLAYYIENVTATLAPTPDAVYSLTVKYICPENTLSTDSDVALIPEWYLDFAAVYCAIKEAERRHDSVLVNLYEASRQRWIQRIKDNQARSKELPYIRTRTDTF